MDLSGSTAKEFRQALRRFGQLGFSLNVEQGQYTPPRETLWSRFKHYVRGWLSDAIAWLDLR